MACLNEDGVFHYNSISTNFVERGHIVLFLSFRQEDSVTNIPGALARPHVADAELCGHYGSCILSDVLYADRQCCTTSGMDTGIPDSLYDPES